MNKHLYFVTTNTDKFQEATQWLKEFAPTIVLEQSKLDLPEIQSLEVKEVTISKAKDAWAKLKAPLLVDDEGLYLEKYPLFPGTVTKFIRQTIGIENVIKLAGDNRNASIINCLVYIDSLDNYQVFEGITHGKLIDPSKPDPEKKLKSVDVLVPNGYSKTFSELRNSEHVKDFHYRYHAFQEFVTWLQRNL